MKTAIVTGASSGIGLAISRELVAMKYCVHGLARDFTKCDFKSENFIHHSIDIRNTNALAQWADKIIQEEERFDVLINNAGVGVFAPHEEISSEQITQMVETNFLAPLILTKLFLREIKKQKGFIIQIASVSALEASSFGAVYSATKAGLRQFGLSLFEETRKSGVKTVTIYPDMTKTNFFDHQNFTTEEAPDTHLLAECVSGAVKTILTQRDGTVVTEMVVRPQRLQIKKKVK